MFSLPVPAYACVFCSYLEHVPRNPTNAKASLPQRRGYVHVCSGLEHVGHIPCCLRSPYMSVCISICMCVCSGACLQRCMYMSRTHNTHIHSHTLTYTRIHTHHTIMNFPHDSSPTKSLSRLGRNIRITRTNQHLRFRSTIPVSFCFV